MSFDYKTTFKDTYFAPEGGRACYYFINYLILEFYTKDHPVWQMSPYIKGGAATFRDNKAKWYFLLASPESFISLLNTFIDDKDRLNKLQDFLETTRDGILAKLTATDVSALSATELSDLIEWYTEQLKLMLRVAGVVRGIDRGITAEIKNHVPVDKIDEVLRIIAAHTKPSFALQEEIALLTSAVKLKKIGATLKDIENEAQKICNTYCFAVLGYFTEQAKPIEYYVGKLTEYVTLDAEKQLAEIESKVAHEKKTWGDYVSNLDPRLKEIARMASESTYMKEYYKYSVNQVAFNAEKIFEEVARRTGWTVPELKNLNLHEMAALARGEHFDKEAIKKRTEYNVGFEIGENVYIYTGKEAQEIEDTYLEVKNIGQKEFKGRVACVGHACGVASLILGSDEFHKMKKDNILVVLNTSPDYVPIMHKASAIVAEEGGLTAHVSVVSREFGIPCVVGIRGITKMIKDGDRLEVDAQKGIVKIIS